MTEPSRYDRLDPIARALVDDYDALDLAAMLVATQDQLAALRAVARGYCPACGRDDAAPTVADWEQQKQRADQLHTRMNRLADRWDLEGPPPGNRPLTELRAEITAATFETEETAGPTEPSLYEKIVDMFGGPLPPPADAPPATAIPCNHAQLRQPHDPHAWQPQPGMRHVQCPGHTRVPADTTKEN